MEEIKVGDILVSEHSSYSDYYKVLKRTEKSVVLTRLDHETRCNTPHATVNTPYWCVPTTPYGSPFTRRVKVGYKLFDNQPYQYVNADGFYTAVIWDGNLQTKYCWMG